MPACQFKIFAMQTYYLLETEPSAYPFAQLLKHKISIWCGIRNATACKHMFELQRVTGRIIHKAGSAKSSIGKAGVTHP
jgi:predicted RNA-binding protein with PUA-like domain